MPKYKRSAPRYKSPNYRKEPTVVDESTLKLCNTGHRAITYFGRNCPFCEKINELENRIEELESSYEELVAEHEEMEEDMEFYRRRAGL